MAKVLDHGPYSIAIAVAAVAISMQGTFHRAALPRGWVPVWSNKLRNRRRTRSGTSTVWHARLYQRRSGIVTKCRFFCECVHSERASDSFARHRARSAARVMPSVEQPSSPLRLQVDEGVTNGMTLVFGTFLVFGWSFLKVQ